MGLTTHGKGHLCSGRSSGWLDFGKEMEAGVLPLLWNGALGMVVGCRPAAGLEKRHREVPYTCEDSQNAVSLQQGKGWTVWGPWDH